MRRLGGFSYRVLKNPFKPPFFLILEPVPTLKLKKLLKMVVLHVFSGLLSILSEAGHLLFSVRERGVRDRQASLIADPSI